MSALRANKKREERMLTHPTHDRLVALGLTGMAKALDEQRRQRNVDGAHLRGAARRCWSIARPSSARANGSSRG